MPTKERSATRRESWTPDDLRAVKAVHDPLRDGLVYLGHHARASDGFPGVWSRRRNATHEAPAEWHGGGVGDLLAVALSHDPGHLDELWGQLVVLYQAGRYTHLGVVRSEKAVTVDKGTANGPYDRLVWLEVLAMDPVGLVLDEGVPESSLPWRKGGGHFTRLDEVGALQGGAADRLRARLWDGFGMTIPDNVQRSARRP